MSFGPDSQSRVDIFVHPDFHRLHNMPINEQVRAYEEALHAQIEGASLPILVQDPVGVGQGEFWDRFEPDLRFSTYSKSGDVRDDEVAGLNGILDENGVLEARVHGSYFARCVWNFIRSMSALSDSGVLFYDKRAKIGTPHLPAVTIGHVLNKHRSWQMDALSPSRRHPLTDESHVYYAYMAR